MVFESWHFFKLWKMRVVIFLFVTWFLFVLYFSWRLFIIGVSHVVIVLKPKRCWKGKWISSTGYWSGSIRKQYSKIVWALFSDWAVPISRATALTVNSICLQQGSQGKTLSFLSLLFLSLFLLCKEAGSWLLHCGNACQCVCTNFPLLFSYAGSFFFFFWFVSLVI